MRNEWKRGLTALCAVILLLGLSACKAGTTPVQSAQSAASAQSAQESSAQTSAEEAITYTLETNLVENSAAAEDGTMIAMCSYGLPILRAWRADGSEITMAQSDRETAALETVATFDAKFEGITDAQDFQEMVEWANEHYAALPEDFEQDSVPYTDEMTYTAWQTPHFISICGDCYSYLGGAHPNSVELGWCFDLDAGAFVEAMDLVTDGEAFQEAVTQEIIRQADAFAAENGAVPEEFFWENYQEIAAEWTNYAVSFDGDGMRVTFSAYEMACYAVGPQTYTFDYEFLSPYLSDYGRTMLAL